MKIKTTTTLIKLRKLMCTEAMAVNIYSICTRLHSQSAVYRMPALSIVISNAKLALVTDICIKAALLQHEDKTRLEFIFNLEPISLIKQCITATDRRLCTLTKHIVLNDKLNKLGITRMTKLAIKFRKRRHVTSLLYRISTRNGGQMITTKCIWHFPEVKLI